MASHRLFTATNSLLLGFIVLGIFTVNRAHAQDLAKSITLAPLVFELAANPGQILTEQLRVTNRSQVAITVAPEVRDFTPVGEAGEVTILEEEAPETASLRVWTTVSPSEITLAPNETRTVTFTIRIPGNAEPGGHYGSILAASGGAAPEGTGVGVAQKIGALVLLRVAGDAREALQLAEFSAPSFSEKGPVPFTVRFANTGNVHVKPAGFITVLNMWGREVAKIELEQKNAIPGSVRRLEPRWDIKGGFGRFTATLTATYGTKQQNITGVTTFMIFPWKVGVPVAAGALLLLVYLVRRRQRLVQALRVLFGRG